MANNGPMYVTAWGIHRSVAEWARLPQCRVSEAELRRRLLAGIRPEVAISSPLPPAAPKPRPLDKVPYDERLTELANPTPRNRKRISRYIGVSKRDGIWYAQIRTTRFKVRYLGSFEDEIAAAVAYDREAAKVGKKLNFPPHALKKPDAKRS